VSILWRPLVFLLLSISTPKQGNEVILYLFWYFMFMVVYTMRNILSILLEWSQFRNHALSL
jgi:hypothetical protein